MKSIIKSVIPVIMAGILGIYGLIVAIILKQNIKQEYNDWVISKLIDNYNKFVGNKYSYIAEVRSYLPIYQFLFFRI